MSLENEIQSIMPSETSCDGFELAVAKQAIPVIQENLILAERELSMSNLRSIIALKEQIGGDVTKEKVELIEKINNVQYSPEEMESFDNWKRDIPRSSMEQPIKIDEPQKVLSFLPNAANYTDEAVNMFFSLSTDVGVDDLDTIFKSFSQHNPNFEISITQYSGTLLSIGIGDKTRDKSMRMDGAYYGHYHPVGNFKLEQPETLPSSFVLGLLPSPGDIRGFLKNPEAVKGGTRIYSTLGSVVVTPRERFENPDEIVAEYKRAYFDLFLGTNKFGFTSDEDMIQYFKDHFQIDLQFLSNEAGGTTSAS